MKNKDNNKLLLQSYKLTTIRNDFGIYAQRLIVRIVEQMQYRIEDADFLTKEIKPSDERLKWTFDMGDIIDVETKNHNKVKQELRKVIKASVHVEESPNVWGESVVFTDIRFNNGTIWVKINDSVWHLFVEMSKGYKRYALKTAMELNSTYALRIYQLISENIKPLTYSIDWLKKMFGVENKYKKPTDFINKCIIPAQKELDAKSEVTFTFSEVRTSNGKGRPSITGLTLTPVKVGTNTNFDIQHKEFKRKNGLAVIPTDIRDTLIYAFKFSERGVKANSDLISDMVDKFGHAELKIWLAHKIYGSTQVKNPQGWLINAMKKELAKDS